MLDPIVLFLDRSELSRVFQSPRSIDAFENLQRYTGQVLPGAVNGAQDAADAAQTEADSASAAAAAAQSTADTIAAAALVVTAFSGALTNERQLSGGTGVTIDTATANLVKVVVNVITALGYTPANKAGDTFTGAVDVQGLLSCDNLKIDQTPGASATVSSHSVAIDCNGTTYYMRLSATP